MAMISQTELVVAEAQRRELLATAARGRRGMAPRSPPAEPALWRYRLLTAAAIASAVAAISGGSGGSGGGRGSGLLRAGAWRQVVSAVIGQRR